MSLAFCTADWSSLHGIVEERKERKKEEGEKDKKQNKQKQKRNNLTEPRHCGKWKGCRRRFHRLNSHVDALLGVDLRTGSGNLLYSGVGGSL